MTQTKKAWKSPVEVPFSEIPGKLELSGKYTEFVKDVELRLTQTVNAAIMYEFADEKTAANHACAAANSIRKKYGNGSIRTIARGPKVYVWRGKEWK